MQDRPVADRYGPYEIVAALSAGGMGEVYLARDTRLHRDVALKILPGTIASETDRRRRFLQEARATAALNHPGIVAIYDVDFESEVPFLVTELVEGQTLRHEVDRGALPLKRAIDFAAQLADALSAAHAAGIVHRDLKPENIMVTREGRTKILDLGLAKILSLPESASSAAADRQNQTETSLVFGTAPYMSPEQARGGMVDYRSDQFSLGTVLYEMLAGAHPFRRDSAVETLSAIIQDEPRSLTGLKPAIPAPVIWIVERCLSKDPAERYASTSDLARDLTTLRARMSEAAGMFALAPRSRLQVGLRGGVTVALVIVAAAGWWAAARPAVNPIANHVITPLAVDYPYQGRPAWSPDGKSIAYVAQVDGVLQVLTRPIGSTQPAQLTRRMFDCYDPFWSPDGRRVYFHSQARDKPALWVVSTASGEPELVQPNAARATISPDAESLVFFKQEGDLGEKLTLWAAPSAALAEARKLDVGFDQRGLGEARVRFAPDGSKFLVWAYGYLAPPHQSDHDLFWILSWPEAVSRKVLSLGRQQRDATVEFDWFPDSRHLAISLGDRRTSGRHLWLADTEQDRVEALTMTAGSEGSPSVSPDGSRIAFTGEEVDFDLWSIPNDGAAPQPLLATSRNEVDPAWSPGRSNFAFVTDRNGSLRLLARSRDDFEREIVSDALFPGDRTWAISALAFSPDGSRIAYQRLGESSGNRVWISSAVTAGPPVQLAPLPLGTAAQDAPAWSPDSAWIAYVQGQPGGSFHLMKTRVGGGGETVVLNNNALPVGGVDWSPDGRAILFDSRDGLAITDPQGQNTKVISEEIWIAHEWADSRTVFGLREADEKRRHFMLVALDVKTTRERVINPDLGIIPAANFPIRGLAQADTGAWVTSVARARSVINMLEGFSLPKSASARLRSLFTRP
jgi:dipeptidyl aminopeptidase/acylaminoacyl peptidase